MDTPPIKMVALGRFVSAIEGTVLPRQEFYARDAHRAQELESIGCARRLEVGAGPLEPVTVTEEPPPEPVAAPSPASASPEPEPEPEESTGPAKSRGASGKPAKR